MVAIGYTNVPKQSHPNAIPEAAIAPTFLPSSTMIHLLSFVRYVYVLETRTYYQRPGPHGMLAQLSTVYTHHLSVVHRVLNDILYILPIVSRRVSTRPASSARSERKEI